MKQGCEDSKEKRELFDHNYHGKDWGGGDQNCTYLMMNIMGW